jgi:hypothetical protein
MNTFANPPTRLASFAGAHDLADLPALGEVKCTANSFLHFAELGEVRRTASSFLHLPLAGRSTHERQRVRRVGGCETAELLHRRGTPLNTYGEAI